MKINTDLYFYSNYSTEMSYLQGHKLLQTQQPILSVVFGPGHFGKKKKKKNLLLVTSFITANSYLDRLEIFEIS